MFQQKKSFKEIQPGDPICICIKGVQSHYTVGQLHEYIKNSISREYIEITDFLIIKVKEHNDVYVCFSNWLDHTGVPFNTHYMMDITWAFECNISYSIPALSLDNYSIYANYAEWTIHYVDSVRSYNDIVCKYSVDECNINMENLSNVITRFVKKDNNVDDDNDTDSTHSSMPGLIEWLEEEEERMRIEDEEEEENEDVLT